MATQTRDMQEPPEAPALPFIGHIIGLARGSFNYYVTLSRACKLPIFTMSLPGQKIYVVTQPEIILAAQKDYRVLAFPPIKAKFAGTVCGASSEAQAIVSENVNGDDGEWGLSLASDAAMKQGLQPGREVDAMNRVMINEVTSSFDSLSNALPETSTVPLYTWLRKTLTSATTNAVYGPGNPFKDPTIADAFWDFEHGLMTILMGVFPKWTAPKAIAGRTKVAEAFEQYYLDGRHEQASLLTKLRYQIAVDHNIPFEDIARYEVGGSIAALVNTVPAAFWTIFLFYSNADLLSDIRKEIDAVTRVESLETKARRSLDVTTVKDKCPLFLSAFQEVLRYRSMGTSVRQVMEDTSLCGYLLKKGAMLQMPSRVIHQDIGIWGSDVEEFQPRRFMKGEKHKTVNGEAPKSVCFRAFGGGKSLCPGRHFATNEVIAAAALTIARFDLSPCSGIWTMPTTANTNVAAVIMEPDNDIDVNISVRAGFEDCEWSVSLHDSDQVVAMVAEDQVAV